MLVGHSYVGAATTKADNDRKVVRLVYLVAFAPGEVKSTNSVSRPYPRSAGQRTSTRRSRFSNGDSRRNGRRHCAGAAERERQILSATQGRKAAAVFGATVNTAAWKSIIVARLNFSNADIQGAADLSGVGGRRELSSACSGCALPRR